MSYVPEQPNIYQGKQVIINSDRLLFNAKDDSILLIADKAIVFNTQGTINFDTGTSPTKNKITLNSPQIHLGLNSEAGFAEPTEPAVLGDKLETVILELIHFLEFDLKLFLRSEFVLKVPGGFTAGVAGGVKFNNLDSKLSMIKKMLKTFKSETVKLT